MAINLLRRGETHWAGKKPSLHEDPAVRTASTVTWGTQRNDGPQGAFGPQANTPGGV